MSNRRKSTKKSVNPSAKEEYQHGPSSDKSGDILLVARCATYSRLFVVIFILVSWHFGQDYDRSTDLLDIYDSSCSSAIDRLLVYTTRPFVRWDALYQLDIALNGYRSEQQLAFFPGYPMVIRLFANTCCSHLTQSSRSCAIVWHISLQRFWYPTLPLF